MHTAESDVHERRKHAYAVHQQSAAHRVVDLGLHAGRIQAQYAPPFVTLAGRASSAARSTSQCGVSGCGVCLGEAG